MVQHGELIEWNDERGFGFIHPDSGGPRLFVHISQIGRIATRPRLGDRVSYAIGRGRDGGPAAVNVTIAGANPVKARALARGTGPAARPSRHHTARYPAAALLAALVLAGTATGLVSPYLSLAYAAMGAISACVYYADKRQAEAGRWRTSEARLHSIDLLFGIIGGLLAQQIFRHKTAKPEFALTSAAIAVLHALLLLGLLSGRLSLAELASFIPG
jgi:uncharacterized membrane protein YsdA (DUF1294 family)/cold shock CspA family protein